MTMLIAGHETTATVLTWTLFLLKQHPDAQQRVLAEISQDQLGEPHSSFNLSTPTPMVWSQRLQ